LWYFAVLALLPHGSEKYFMVFGPLLAGIVLIALPFISNRGERSPRRRPWAIASVLIIVLMIATLWVQGLNSPWSPNFKAQPLPPLVVGTTTGPVFIGAQLFQAKGCLNCHAIGNDGGRRGPV
jgi:ubiquinol-cytochrome c reductase cytochrome b subunit